MRLAHAIKLDRTTVAGVVSRLEKKALITRAPAPHDRRSNLLYLTDSGRKLLAVLLPAADRAQRKMLATLSAEERKLFLDLMVRVVGQDVPAGQKQKKSA